MGRARGHWFSRVTTSLLHHALASTMQNGMPPHGLSMQCTSIVLRRKNEKVEERRQRRETNRDTGIREPGIRADSCARVERLVERSGTQASQRNLELIPPSPSGTRHGLVGSVSQR